MANMDVDIQDDASSPDVMMQFYKRVYPFKSIFNWLNHQHAPTRLFTHREFAFTLQGDTYLRYNSFTTADELKRQTVRLNPTRFEIGPVYNARVSVASFLACRGSRPSFAASRQEDITTWRAATSPARTCFRY